MSKKSRLFTLMMKREKLLLRQKAHALDGLLTDQAKLAELNEKLANLLTENEHKAGPQTVQALRSRAHYGREMAEQKEFAKNRLEFLDIEIVTAQTRLAHSKQREQLLGEKAHAEHQDFIKEAEKVAEQLAPTRKVSF